MTIFTETGGSGPDLVLVHGWGLHGGVWGRLLPLLERDFRVTRVDLPGHGRSARDGVTNLDGMVDAVLAAVPECADWLGWSLGSLVATAAALDAPARVGRLVVLAGTPCFVRRPDWSAAMQPELLDSFAADLREDYVTTLNRFLALQVHGSEAAGAILRELRTELFAHGEPDAAALQAGLGILRDTDLRERLPQLEQRVLYLMGARDTLVPAAAGEAAARLAVHGRSRVVAGAGHAPFLARPAEVAVAVREFLGSSRSRGERRRHV